MPVMASREQTAGVTSEPKVSTNNTVWIAQKEVGEIDYPTHHTMNVSTTTHDMQAQSQPRHNPFSSKHASQHQCMHPIHLDSICQTGSRPDDRLELVKAGDVEVNPGPEEEEVKCHECEKKLSRNYLTCSGCSLASHKKEECSGLKHSQSKDNWMCKICKPPVERKTCRECGKKETGAQKFLTCIDCK